jgi:hypothetical protein
MLCRALRPIPEKVPTVIHAATWSRVKGTCADHDRTMEGEIQEPEIL